ncbi:MAG: hypothetical protein LJE83_06405 [Gammaproteobacteria bacterium]|nr:hypothetical protein [Gammaproteobacteria bacterium]
MRIFIVLFIVLLVVLAVYPFLKPSENKETLTGMPWQIEILPDGSTRVFGIKIGTSQLYGVIAVLGSNMELAIVASNDEAGNLEMYYGDYQAGLLSGKLVLQTDASQLDIQRWRDNAVKSEFMASGKAKKYTLSNDDVTQALKETVTGISFIPAVNLDEEVILARFDEPEKRIQLTGVTHFLYPAKGLDIALYDDSKEVLQYVAPEAFQQLMEPLQ